MGWGTDLADERITLFPQAALLLDAIDAFSAEHAVGAGIFLVAHSYGLKVALTMAAEEARGARLLGLDGAGSGIRYAFNWDRDGDLDIPRTIAGDRGPAWGPAALYPAETFQRGALPLAAMPAVQAAEGGRWPDDLRAIGSRIRIPIRLTYGEHERYWPIDEAHVEELRAALPNVPRLTVEIEPLVGHNISLGWAARSYHLKVLAFAESCIMARRLG